MGFWDKSDPEAPDDNLYVDISSYSGNYRYVCRLYDGEIHPDCEHVITEQWSGVRCTKCPAWFCY